MCLLTKDEKTILDILLLLFPEGEKFSAFHFYNHADIAKFPYDYVAEVCRSLSDRGCIRDLEVDDVETVSYLAIDNKGRTYRERQRLEKKERWKERAWGFVTGAIIATLPWLFSL